LPPSPLRQRSSRTEPNGASRERYNRDVTITLRYLASADSDLDQVVAELNDEDRWGDFDRPFTVASLKRFLESDHHFYLLACVGDEIAGAAHAYLLQHPAGSLHLYIDEVDTSKRHRRKGVATAMMQELIRLSRQLGAEDAWLGTEDDNDPAKALYRSLRPSTVEYGPLFTFENDRH
jgi:ribosomal protein S18 acetylase RimI-like enzyme